jgi:hypothetical protein
MKIGDFVYLPTSPLPNGDVALVVEIGKRQHNE